MLSIESGNRHFDFSSIEELSEKVPLDIFLSALYEAGLFLPIVKYLKNFVSFESTMHAKFIL